MADKMTIGNSIYCRHGSYPKGTEGCPYCRMEDKAKTPHERAVEALLEEIRDRR